MWLCKPATLGQIDRPDAGGGGGGGGETILSQWCVMLGHFGRVQALEAYFHALQIFAIFIQSAPER